MLLLFKTLLELLRKVGISAPYFDLQNLHLALPVSRMWSLRFVFLVPHASGFAGLLHAS